LFSSIQLVVSRCYPSLQAAVDDARTNDVVLIPSGIHSLLNINALRQGGTLMGMNFYSIFVNCRLKCFIFSGVGSREDVVIHLGSSTEVGLLFEGGQVTLKNLTILVNNKQSGISVKVLILFHFNYFRRTVMFFGYRGAWFWNTVPFAVHRQWTTRLNQLGKVFM
jgi:hypothetical protein